MRMTAGKSSTSEAMSTSGPMKVVAGSHIVTPAAMWASLMRRCMTRVASASWPREFTPRHCSASSVL